MLVLALLELEEGAVSKAICQAAGDSVSVRQRLHVSLGTILRNRRDAVQVRWTILSRHDSLHRMMARRRAYQ